MRELPKVSIRGKTYYQDDRLREFRNVKNIDDRITFEEYRKNFLNEKQLAEYNKSWFRSYRERNCKECQLCKNTDEEIEDCNESRESAE